jgi:hypothetical protein
MTDPDLQCPSIAWLPRTGLVASNLAYLVPLAVCIALGVCRAPRRSAHGAPASFLAREKAAQEQAARGCPDARGDAATSDLAVPLNAATGDSPTDHAAGTRAAADHAAADRDDALVGSVADETLVPVDPTGVRISIGGVSGAELLHRSALAGGPRAGEKAPRRCSVRRAFAMAPEVAALLAVFVCSSLYHACYDSYTCTRWCVPHSRGLGDADFIAAFQAFSLVVLHTKSELRHVVAWKYVGFCVCAAVNVFGVIYIVTPAISDPPHTDGQPDPEWHPIPVADLYAALAGLYTALVIARIIVDREQLWREVRNWRCRWLLSAMASGAAAVWLQLSLDRPAGEPEPADYWWKHSLWHACTALGLACRFLV